MAARGRTADPARLVGLLWSPSTVVGRGGLTLASVTRSAVAAADEHGLDHLTMRSLADDVGVGTMTLYRYVPGRAELLELMLDAVAADVYAGHPLPRSRRTLHTAVRYIAQRNWEHLLAHPWIPDIPPGRPVLGPGVCRKYEHELEPLDAHGLPDRVMDELLTSVLSLVQVLARWHVALEHDRTTSRLTDEQWWISSQVVLDRVMPTSEYPIAARVGTSVASAGDPYATLQFALTAIVDSLVPR